MPDDASRQDLPFDVASVTTARSLVTDLLTDLGADRRAIEDANIVVGELVMNAVRHGRPRADHTVEIAWSVHEGGLRFSVCDGGETERLVARMPGPDSFGGRGLAMVAMLCDGWSHDDTEGTRIVADIPADLPRVRATASH